MEGDLTLMGHNKGELLHHRCEQLHHSFYVFSAEGQKMREGQVFSVAPLVHKQHFNKKKSVRIDVIKDMQLLT